jgi:hypothetical protein
LQKKKGKTTLVTGTRNTKIHNYQPQEEIQYILLSFLATSFENFGSHRLQELSCLLHIIHFL